MKLVFLITSTILMFSHWSKATQSYFDTNSDPEKITHCYHWLKEKEENRQFLSYKLNYAKNNNGKLTFHTTAETSTGAMAGDGLYCARNIQVSARYGDRVIRVDFVDDIKIKNVTTTTGCRVNGIEYDQNNCPPSEEIGVIYYDAKNDYYVVKDPKFIKSWTASSEGLRDELVRYNKYYTHYFEQKFYGLIDIITTEINSGQSQIFGQ